MTEREAFEAWAKKAGWPHHFTSCNTKDPTAYSQESWEVWQAARAQPAQPLKTDPLFVFAQEVIHGAYKPEELKDAAMRAIRHHSAQPAQAVPVLTEQEIVKCLTASGCVGTIKMSYDSGPYEITRTSINADRFARRVEQAVRAKMGVAVPMTDEQAKDIAQQETWGPDAIAMEALLIGVIRQAERHHGIVGKEGA